MSLSVRALSKARTAMPQAHQRRTFIDWMTNYPDKVRRFGFASASTADGEGILELLAFAMVFIFLSCISTILVSSSIKLHRLWK